MYNIAEYKTMADRFYNKWIEAHHGEPLSQELESFVEVKVGITETEKDAAPVDASVKKK